MFIKTNMALILFQLSECLSNDQQFAMSLVKNSLLHFIIQSLRATVIGGLSVSEQDLVETNLFLLQNLLSSCDCCKELVLQMNFVEVGFDLIDVSAHEEADDYSDVQQVVLMTFAKLVQEYHGEYHRVRKVLKLMVEEFIVYYKCEDSNRDECFFFGSGLELVTDIIASIHSLVECGRASAIEDILSHKNSDHFLTLVVEKFDQKTKYLQIHELQTKQTCNYEYYEELKQLSNMLLEMISQEKMNEHLVNKGLLKVIENAFKYLLCIGQNDDRDS